MRHLTRIYTNVRAWYRRKRAYPHTSAWDNPANGADLLAVMIQADNRRKTRLP